MRRLFLVSLLAACGAGPSPPPEVQRLLAALEEGLPEGRAIARLGPGDADAVPAIVARLERGGGRAVLVPLLQALANIGDPSAAPAVERAIGYEDPHVALEAAACHRRLTGRYAPGLERIVHAALEPGPAHEVAVRHIEAARPLAPQAVMSLELAALASTPGSLMADPERLLSILDALAAAGAEVRGALPMVRASLSVPAARLSALWALHRVGGESAEAVRGLLDAIAASPALGRRPAVALLERVAREAPESSLPLLREAVAAADEARRAAAAHVLAQVTPRGS